MSYFGYDSKNLINLLQLHASKIKIRFGLQFKKKKYPNDVSTWILQFSITFPSLQSIMPQAIGTYDLVILLFLLKKLKKNISSNPHQECPNLYGKIKLSNNLARQAENHSNFGISFAIFGFYCEPRNTNTCSLKPFLTV